MGAGLDALVRDLIMVQETGRRRVGLLPDVHEVFCELETRWRVRFERYFTTFGTPGLILPPEHFKPEGRFPTGGPKSRDVMVSVFKAYQCRIYGVTVQLNAVATFVGMEIVTNKKTDRADQELLRRVARNSQPFSD